MVTAHECELGDGKFWADEKIIMDQQEEQRDESSEVIDELIGVIEYVKAIGEFRVTQRKEGHGLVRRLKLLVPLLEEIKDLNTTPIPEDCLACLRKLKKAFHSAKKLLKACYAGSKIYLVRIFILLINLFLLYLFIYVSD